MSEAKLTVTVSNNKISATRYGQPTVYRISQFVLYKYNENAVRNQNDYSPRKHTHR